MSFHDRRRAITRQTQFGTSELIYVGILPSFSLSCQRPCPKNLRAVPQMRIVNRPPSLSRVSEPASRQAHNLESMVQLHDTQPSFIG